MTVEEMAFRGKLILTGLIMLLVGTYIVFGLVGAGVVLGLSGLFCVLAGAAHD